MIQRMIKFLSVVAKEKMRGERLSFLLTIPEYSQSTLLAKSRWHIPKTTNATTSTGRELMHASLALNLLLHCYSLRPKVGECCSPQQTDSSHIISLISTISHNVLRGQSGLSSIFLKLPFQVILGYVKLTIQTNPQSIDSS